MSAADHHRVDALDALAGIPLACTDERAALLASQATAYALLAVETRLGELVEQQRTATLLAGSAYGLVTPALAEAIMSRAEAEVAAGLRAETTGGDS